MCFVFNVGVRVLIRHPCLTLSAVAQVPGRLHPISVSYLAQRAEGTQRRSVAQQRELAAKGGRRQAIERINPTPYLR